MMQINAEKQLPCQTRLNEQRNSKTSRCAYLTTSSTARSQWIKISLLNPHHPQALQVSCCPCQHQHPHDNRLPHTLPLPNLLKQVDQSGIIDCLLAMRMSI